jgi:hypothetical protein
MKICTVGLGSSILVVVAALATSSIPGGTGTIDECRATQSRAGGGIDAAAGHRCGTSQVAMTLGAMRHVM